jgi:hypothetical protein
LQVEASMKNFMKILLLIFALIAFFALLAPISLSQNKPPEQKPNGTKYSRVKYDRAAEVTVIGTVDEVLDFDCPVTNTEGAHVVLRTADARIMVHIAPVSFLKQFGIELKKGEKLQVIGARMKDGEGGDTIIAREITSNEVVLGVRTPDGKPLW